jgi:hypothetical protein
MRKNLTEVSVVLLGISYMPTLSDDTSEKAQLGLLDTRLQIMLKLTKGYECGPADAFNEVFFLLQSLRIDN